MKVALRLMGNLVTDEDRDFLLDQINSRLSLDEPLTKDSIIAERCGVGVELAQIPSERNLAGQHDAQDDDDENLQ